MLEKCEMVRVGVCGVLGDIVRPVTNKHEKLPLFVTWVVLFGDSRLDLHWDASGEHVVHK